ncbi:HIT family protein [Actinocorallia sp. A-T 12471]|uniref:HIT family protein n=1 Tax=Actinocorallia sp. A-T 12471 TaxID=3089813 RepID=UPI0029D08C6F|nr:HIT family protein [Actinocorallia sp. A-T 12471]MDX6743277.1 HIT family protein [Actinocorallia sp. A-T 12471]
MDECVFCGVVAGEVGAEVVLDVPEAVGFLDARPLFKGHVLVVPRRHAETLTDLTPEEVGPFFEVVREVAGAVEKGLDAAGTFVAMNNKVSQSVPHLHVHVVPRNRKDGLRGFFWPRHRYDSDEERAEYGRRVREALEASEGR